MFALISVCGKQRYQKLKGAMASKIKVYNGP